MGHLDDILVPLSVFAMVTLIVYFTSKYSYLKKKGILEQGRNIERISNIEFKKSRFPYLEIGLTTVGVGLGLAISVIFQNSDIPSDSKDILTRALVLVFGGIGLISGSFLGKYLDGKDKR
ncbi:MAG: hypothetical protein ACK5IQ_07755 [Bacteroidales bacterium]